MTRIALTIGGDLLGVWLLITVALAIKALKNQLGGRAGAAVGLGRRIRVGLGMLPLAFYSAGALIVNAVALLLATTWYRARGKTVPWQDSGIPAASLQQSASKGGIAFYFEGQIVGIFLQDGAPSTSGQHPYEPYRGPGHFALKRELDAGRTPRCYSDNGAQRIVFAVNLSATPGILAVSAVTTERPWG